MSLRIHLRPSLFDERENILVQSPDFECATFRFKSGVAALRIRNKRGEVVVLPYQGQQVWRARFDGRELTMKSMFDEPSGSTDYLRTYGAFFIHCGLTGLGAPGPQDNHPLHGELPNAPFGDAAIEVDTTGKTLRVTGSYQHTVAFSTNYRAISTLSLDSDATLLDITLEVQNLKRTPMELLYLGHANFRPVDGGRLVYCANYVPQNVRVRRSIPAHITPPAGYKELLQRLADEPMLHHTLCPDAGYDPEVVFSIDMVADAEGWTHALQIHPDGGADYASHRPEQTPCTVRWLCRTADQDALGLSFPATSGVEGRHAEVTAGRFVQVLGGDVWRADMRLGALTASEAAARAQHIERCMGRLDAAQHNKED